MSEGEEKTEQPSEFKLREARKKGQVAKSADVVTLVTLASTSAFLTCFLPFCIHRWSDFLNKVNSLGINHIPDYLMHRTLKDAFNLWFLLSIPVLFVASAGAIIGNLGQFGFLLSGHPIEPDIKKLDPIAGLKKLFSKNRAIELVKQIYKFSAVLLVIYFIIRNHMSNVIMLIRVDLSTALLLASDLIAGIFTRVILCFLVIAAFDLYWQRYSFKKSMRMSKHEVKKEYKQQEGDPVFKQERRRLHHETIEAMSSSPIKDASVVITNPSHLAIALKFDEEHDAVPIVIAKGIGLHASVLVKEAKLHDVPIMRNVPLARDLSWLDINEEIPKNLYDSVAEILTFVHELNATARGSRSL
ncbi:MAG TPA: EscU/YscU/HrcU family type III secretion system export apparatus switch protein [Myxococcota bacterium]|nr:EscU/YscU/HrcU family type III secretion system export apparatus switch protein [Myxococcota bacterium]